MYCCSQKKKRKEKVEGKGIRETRRKKEDRDGWERLLTNR
jgi:hypothetical protein